MLTGETKKKLLILNGSHSEIPLISSARDLGFYVITTGNDASLIGHSFSDEYHPVDYSDKEAILALAKQLDIDFICSCANDFGTITASYVAEKMALPGQDSYQTSLVLHHKDKFKQFAADLDIPTPFSKSVNSLEAALDVRKQFKFPVIVKPVDLTGGKGVNIVNTSHAYQKSVREALQLSRQGRIVVEEYFEGSLHSFSSFLVNQKVRFSFSDNEYSFKNPYSVSTSAAPASGIEKYAARLVNSVETMASTLHLRDGIFHAQFLANGQEATIIDITRRCSGDLYPYPVSYACNTDWASWIVRAETGADCSTFPELKQQGFCGRHCVMSDRDGTIKNVFIDDRIKPHIFDQLWWWSEDDKIDCHIEQKLGVIFLKYKSEEEMLSLSQKLTDYVKVILK